MQIMLYRKVRSIFFVTFHDAAMLNTINQHILALQVVLKQ